MTDRIDEDFVDYLFRTLTDDGFKCIEINDKRVFIVETGDSQLVVGAREVRIEEGKFV